MPVPNYYNKGEYQMSIKTDLAKEIIDRISPEYSKKLEFYRAGTKITRIAVENPKDSALINKPIGKYITVEADSPRMLYGKFDEEAEAIASELKELLPKSGDILVAGIGSAFLTADSLGPISAEKIIRQSFKNRKILVLIPGTEARTGMTPGRLILSAVREFSPSAVILIDSLAAENIGNVCKSIQITDSGIAPGSGIFADAAAIDEKFLGVPTVGIGSPTVAGLSEKGVFVSPKDIDFLVQRTASLIAAGISLAVFPELGIEFIKEISR